MTFLILGYVVVYQLAYQCMYLYQSGVAGAVRFTLQQPTQDGCDPTYAGCKNAFSNTGQLSYCTEDAGGLYPDGNKYGCEFFENIGAQQVMDSSILIATRTTSYKQVLACNSSSEDNCPYVYNTTAQSTKYVVDAEQFTVLIDHSVLASNIPSLQESSSAMSGRLLVNDNEQLCNEYKHVAYTTVYGDDKYEGSGDCYVAPNTTSRNLDYFSLDVLMRAAGTTLDSPNYGGETYRETGVTMLLKISYDNYEPWKGPRSIYYYYDPYLVSGSSYKYYDAVYSGPPHNYRKERTLLNKHGVYIQAVQQGSLRDFNFNNLLIQLTTSLTLFAVATVVTDFCAIYLLPDHEVYEAYKYELTEDFSDRRDQQDATAAAAAAAAAGGGGGGNDPLLDISGSGNGVNMVESGHGARDSRGASGPLRSSHHDRDDLMKDLLERRPSGSVVRRKD